MNCSPARDRSRTNRTAATVPGSHARAGTDAGLDPRFGPHLLVARSRGLVQPA
jgi:hypothetical protein